MAKIESISALLDGWQTITRAQMRTLEPGTLIAITRLEPCSGRSTLYTVYRPLRRRDESPVQYHKRTGVVDDRFTYRHRGRYYCNPAHCSRSWVDRAERDVHLKAAYSVLD
jgi:hypothetical protein